MFRRLGVSLIIAAATVSQPVFAAPWTVDYANSRLGFEGVQNNIPFQGKFSKFSAMVDFSFDKPQDGNITATIDTSSASLGDKERDGYLMMADWFDTSKFPQANFASKTIRVISNDSDKKCLEINGTLTIKSKAQPLMLPVCLTKEGDHWRAKGKVTITRQSYDVGTGQWSSDKVVKSNVDIVVDLSVKPPV